MLGRINNFLHNFGYKLLKNIKLIKGKKSNRVCIKFNYLLGLAGAF